MYDGQRLAREIASAAGVVVEGFACFAIRTFSPSARKGFTSMSRFGDCERRVAVAKTAFRPSYSLIGEQENAPLYCPEIAAWHSVLNGMLPILTLRKKCFREDNWADHLRTPYLFFMVTSFQKSVETSRAAEHPFDYVRCTTGRMGPQHDWFCDRGQVLSNIPLDSLHLKAVESHYVLVNHTIRSLDAKCRA